MWPKHQMTPELDDNALDDDHNDAPLWLWNINELVGDVPAPGPTRRVLTATLNFTMTDEPASFKEAEHQESWWAAMHKEMQAIEDNQTLEVATLTSRHRAIGLKWVFKVKRDEVGKVMHHKARQVVKGYVQRVGIDFDEVFAPIARLESVRMLVELAAHERWQVRHMDVKSAFLNDVIKEEVYVQQAPGFIITGQEEKVLSLCKALYGLRQALRAWNAKLDDTLVSLGFQKSSSEHGVYTRRRNVNRLILGVYVNDLIITGTSSEAIITFEASRPLFVFW
jgi:hypothetical protein